MNDLTPVPMQPASDSSALMQIISRAASDPTLDVAKLQALLAVKKEWEADEARKAYTVAFANFKAEAVRIVKNKLISDGPLRGKRHADLFAAVDAISPALSANGLTASWEITRDEKDWIEVACILTHVTGHSERRKMGSPPDAGGAKNAIQARASTVTYLERYTLLAAVGMTAADSDDDGRGGQQQEAAKPDPWTEALTAEARDAAAKGAKSYAAWWKAQTPDFRSAAIATAKHADFKAAAETA